MSYNAFNQQASKSFDDVTADIVSASVGGRPLTGLDQVKTLLGCTNDAANSGTYHVADAITKIDDSITTVVQSPEYVTQRPNASPYDYDPLKNEGIGAAAGMTLNRS